MNGNADEQHVIGDGRRETGDGSMRLSSRRAKARRLITPLAPLRPAKWVYCRSQLPLWPLLPGAGMFAQHMLIDVKSSSGHLRHGESIGPRRPCGAESTSHVPVAHEERRCGGECPGVSGRDEKTAFVIDDELGQATDTERNGRNPQRHRVNYCGAESFGGRRMPEDVEPRHRGVYLVDETGANGGDATDGRHAG